MKRKFLIALPAFRGQKGFNHRTVLVSAVDEGDAIDRAFHLGVVGLAGVGDIKEVFY